MQVLKTIDSMRIVILVHFLFMLLPVTAQELFRCDKGTVSFYSDAPLEKIEAVCKHLGAILNLRTGEVAVLLKVKDFRFDNALMEEHFNENYMESEKYPNASLKGKISDSLKVIPGTQQEVWLEGDLNIHGITQKRKIAVILIYGNDGSIQVKSKFMITVSDHKIKIPRMVFKNIAEEVEARIDLTLIKK